MELKIDTLFILNDKNVLITTEFVNNIFKKYNINHRGVTDLNLFILATTHNSYCYKSYLNNDENDTHHKTKLFSMNRAVNPNKSIPLQKESYERLEFKGDAIIHHVLADYFYDRFPDQQEGFLTKLRTKIENSDTLAKFSVMLGLDNYVLLSKYLEETNGRQTNKSVLEDVFEAFIGAISLDGKTDKTKYGENMVACYSLIEQLIENVLDISELLAKETNYKDMLLQYAHVKKWPDPIYGVQKVTGIDNKSYEMYVKIKGQIVGVGSGNSKKIGEQKSAEMALRKYKVLNDDSDESEEEYVYEGSDDD